MSEHKSLKIYVDFNSKNLKENNVEVTGGLTMRNSPIQLCQATAVSKHCWTSFVRDVEKEF